MAFYRPFRHLATFDVFAAFRDILFALPFCCGTWTFYAFCSRFPFATPSCFVVLRWVCCGPHTDMPSLGPARWWWFERRSAANGRARMPLFTATFLPSTRTPAGQPPLRTHAHDAYCATMPFATTLVLLRRKFALYARLHTLCPFTLCLPPLWFCLLPGSILLGILPVILLLCFCLPRSTDTPTQ